MKFKINKERLRKEILKSGLSISEISINSKLNRGTIHKVLKEDCNFSSTTIGKLANTLSVDAQELIIKKEAQEVVI